MSESNHEDVASSSSSSAAVAASDPAPSAVEHPLSQATKADDLAGLGEVASAAGADVAGSSIGEAVKADDPLTLSSSSLTDDSGEKGLVDIQDLPPAAASSSTGTTTHATQDGHDSLALNASASGTEYVQSDPQQHEKAEALQAPEAQPSHLASGLVIGPDLDLPESSLTDEPSQQALTHKNTAAQDDIPSSTSSAKEAPELGSSQSEPTSDGPISTSMTTSDQQEASSTQNTEQLQSEALPNSGENDGFPGSDPIAQSIAGENSSEGEKTQSAEMSAGMKDEQPSISQGLASESVDDSQKSTSLLPSAEPASASAKAEEEAAGSSSSPDPSSTVAVAENGSQETLQTNIPTQQAPTEAADETLKGATESGVLQEQTTSDLPQLAAAGPAIASSEAGQADTTAIGHSSASPEQDTASTSRPITPSGVTAGADEEKQPVSQTPLVPSSSEPAALPSSSVPPSAPSQTNDQAVDSPQPQLASPGNVSSPASVSTADGSAALSQPSTLPPEQTNERVHPADHDQSLTGQVASSKDGIPTDGQAAADPSPASQAQSGKQPEQQQQDGVQNQSEQANVSKVEEKVGPLEDDPRQPQKPDDATQQPSEQAKEGVAVPAAAAPNASANAPVPGVVPSEREASASGQEAPKEADASVTDSQKKITSDASSFNLVLSTNEELFKLCVALQEKGATASGLFRDISHRLQTNLAFLAGHADRSNRASPTGPTRSASNTPRVDVFPHPSLGEELLAISKDSPLPRLYNEMAKAFEGSARSSAPDGERSSFSTGGLAQPNGSGSSTGHLKHSRESSSTDEPNKKRQAVSNGLPGSTRASASPAPSVQSASSKISFAHPFSGSGGNNARNNNAGRSASPAGSSTSQACAAQPSSQSSAQDASNGQAALQQLQQQLPPGMPPQQAQQLVQMFGPNAFVIWRMLQSYLRSPQCPSQFTALPLPVQMQHIAGMQQQRLRMLSQQQQQQQQQLGQGQVARPSTPNTASSPSNSAMGPPLSVRNGSPFVSGSEGLSGMNRHGSSDQNANTMVDGSPGSLLRRSASGDTLVRNTPPSTSIQVVNPFAATSGSSGSGSNVSTPGPNVVPGGAMNGMAANFANLNNDAGFNAMQQQQGNLGGPQRLQRQMSQSMMSPTNLNILQQPNQQQQLQSLAHGAIQGGGNLQQQLQQLQQMQMMQQQQQLRQQQQPQQPPQHQQGFTNGNFSNLPNAPTDPNQLPPHIQQLLAQQQIQAPGGNLPALGGISWPGQPGASNNNQNNQGGQGGWPSNLNGQSGEAGGVNPAALFGGGGAQQQGHIQQQMPFNGWAGMS
ncbi:unnamed protein product [Sympodiomycopsis kandeliae]